MARQILVIKTDKKEEEINNIMLGFLEKNGYKNKKYNGEEVLVKNAVPGFTSPQYMKVYIKDGVLKVVAFIKAFGKEYGVDSDYVACVPKKELKSIINSIIVLFNASEQDIINRNTSDRKASSEDSNIEGLKEAKYSLNPDMKASAIISFVLGIIMFFCVFIPFPLYLAIILAIAGIIVGASGVRSSLKALSIIGIILCSIDTLIYVFGFIGMILSIIFM